MTKISLIGIGAGLAALVMLLSPMGGTLLAMPMMLLAPLPVFIAALGWGTSAGVAATLAGIAIALFGLGRPFAASVPTATMFAMAVAVPATFAAHLTGLARRSETGELTQWYPLSRVMMMLALWCSFLGVGVAHIMGLGSPDAIARTAANLTEMFQDMTAHGGAVPAAADIEQLAAMLIGTMPYAFAGLWFASMLLALWIAALVVRRSGLLVRPWQDLRRVQPEPAMVVVLAIAIVVANLPAPLGLYAKPFVGAFSVAHVVIGLAVLHWLSRDWAMRVPALAVFYGLMFIAGLPGLVALVLGLADRFFDLRRINPRSGLEPPAL